MFSNAKFFTLRRGWNFVKLASSYLLTRLLQKTIHLGMPASLAIEPTTTCNLRCPECPSGLRSFTRPTGQIDLADFQKYIDQLYQDIFYLSTYFQGEPYLHNDFFKMIEYAGKHLKYSLCFSDADEIVSISGDPEVPFGADSFYEINIPCDSITQSQDGYYPDQTGLNFWYGDRTKKHNLTMMLLKRPDGDLKVWPACPWPPRPMRPRALGRRSPAEGKESC